MGPKWWVGPTVLEPGDVSNPFQIDGNYIIACLVNIKERGEPPFENVEDAMRAGASKQKKAEMYLDLMTRGTLEEMPRSRRRRLWEPAMVAA